ncbi:MAG: hypothetical protein ACYDEA_00360 [Candidatus Dormibacteria bacterium]
MTLEDALIAAEGVLKHAGYPRPPWMRVIETTSLAGGGWAVVYAIPISGSQVKVTIAADGRAVGIREATAR